MYAVSGQPWISEISVNWDWWFQLVVVCHVLQLADCSNTWTSDNKALALQGIAWTPWFLITTVVAWEQTGNLFGVGPEHNILNQLLSLGLNWKVWPRVNCKVLPQEISFGCLPCPLLQVPEAKTLQSSQVAPGPDCRLRHLRLEPGLSEQQNSCYLVEKIELWLVLSGWWFCWWFCGGSFDCVVWLLLFLGFSAWFVDWRDCYRSQSSFTPQLGAQRVFGFPTYTKSSQLVVWLLDT